MIGNTVKNLSRKLHKGFTTIEVVIVIAIIAVLAINLIPQMSSLTDKAKMSGVETDMRSFYTAAKAIIVEDLGDGLTTQEEFVEKLNKNLDPQMRFNSDLETTAEMDPWGNPYKMIWKSREVDGKTEYGVAFYCTGNPETSTLISYALTEEELAEYELFLSQIAYVKLMKYSQSSRSVQETTTPTEDDYWVFEEAIAEANAPVANPADWEYTSYGSGIEVTAYIGQQSEGMSLVVPSSIDGFPVISIGQRIFEDNTNLKSIVIPDSVTGIKMGAFSGCTSLESVTLSNGLDSIGDNSFAECVNLLSIVTPDSLTSIGSQAFYNCSSLGSIGLNEGLLTIGESAFYNVCYTIIRVPSTVTSIGENAFKNMSRIQIYIGFSVEGAPWGARTVQQIAYG